MGLAGQTKYTRTWISIPFLNKLLESHWFRAHDLLGLVITQLDRVVPSTKRVMQAGLIGCQVDQKFSCALIFYH